MNNLKELSRKECLEINGGDNLTRRLFRIIGRFVACVQSANEQYRSLQREQVDFWPDQIGKIE